MEPVKMLVTLKSKEKKNILNLTSLNLNIYFGKSGSHDLHAISILRRDNQMKILIANIMQICSHYIRIEEVHFSCEIF